MRKPYLLITTVAAALLGNLDVVQSHAATFTNEATFLAALPGPAGVLNFDSLAGGLILSNTTQTVTGGPGTGILFPGPFQLGGNNP